MSTITKWLSITLVDLWADGTQWPWHQRSCAEYVGILHSQLKSLPRGLGGGDFHQVILHEESTWLDLFRIFYALPKTEGLVWGWKCLNVWTPSGRLYFTFCAVTRGPLHRATERAWHHMPAGNQPYRQRTLLSQETLGAISMTEKSPEQKEIVNLSTVFV